jgi:hypothetical protein
MPAIRSHGHPGRRECKAGPVPRADLIFSGTVSCRAFFENDPILKMQRPS